MKKFKLIISDVHLGKGRTQPNGTTNTLEEFFYDEQLVEFFDYYMSGEFKSSEVELIINGDFLNLLQVDYKGHFVPVITESMSLFKLKSIVEGHPKVFKKLREFVANKGRSLTYVIGNHDQGLLWPSCRRYLSEVLDTNINYRNLVYFVDGVHIEHGHMHEAANRIDPRKFFLRKDLPEPILNLPFGSHFFVDFVLRIKEERPYVDKVRPFHAFIRWGLLHDTWFTVRTLIGLLVYFFSCVFV